MANTKKVQRELEESRRRAEDWSKKAQIALSRNREDLARAALVEKRRWLDRADILEKEMDQCDVLVEQYQEDIQQLEEKLNMAREKQRILIQRHIHARKKRRAQEEIQRIDNTDTWIRFEQFENRIERMEAEADLVNKFRQPTLEDEFDRLEGDEEIERELEALKAEMSKVPREDTSA
jgi:phage shock protein A